MGESEFVRQAEKRILRGLDDAKLLAVDEESGESILAECFDTAIMYACLRWAYTAGYTDGHEDSPAFTKNEASEPWATLPT